MADKKQPHNSLNEDRHVSKFMVRLPEKYRDMLKKWQFKHKQEFRVRPSMVNGVLIALEDFLRKHDVWEEDE